MGKCDITINKGLTINDGNYESLRPDVSVTFKDVDVETLNSFYEKADDLVGDLLVLNTASLKNIKNVIKYENLENVVNDILKNVIKHENLENVVDDVLKNFEKL